MINIGVRAGHRGAVIGSKGTSGGGYKEVDLNIKVADKIKIRLKEHGFNPIETSGDLGNNLYNYYNSKLTKNDLLLCPHHNGYTPESNGSEVLVSVFADEKTLKHAKMLLQLFIDSYGTKNRGIVQRKNTSTGKDYYGIIRNTVPKVILGEPIFMTNKKDMEIVKNFDKFINIQAECYVQVACSWYNVKYKPLNVLPTTNNNNDIKKLFERIELLEQKNTLLEKKQERLDSLLVEIQNEISENKNLIIDNRDLINKIEKPEGYNEVLKLIEWIKSYE